jgi:hypothetical protein
MFLDHTHFGTHAHGRTPLNEWSARRRGCYLHNTQQTQQTNIHAPSGIRTCDCISPAAACLHLRLHGHRYRAHSIFVHYFFCSFCSHKLRLDENRDEIFRFPQTHTSVLTDGLQTDIHIWHEQKLTRKPASHCLVRVLHCGNNRRLFRESCKTRRARCLM